MKLVEFSKSHFQENSFGHGKGHLPKSSSYSLPPPPHPFSFPTICFSLKESNHMTHFQLLKFPSLPANCGPSLVPIQNSFFFQKTSLDLCFAFTPPPPFISSMPHKSLFLFLFLVLVFLSAGFMLLPAHPLFPWSWVATQHSFSRKTNIASSPSFPSGTH